MLCLLGHRDHDGPLLSLDRRDDCRKQPFARAEVVEQHPVAGCRAPCDLAQALVSDSLRCGEGDHPLQELFPSTHFLRHVPNGTVLVMKWTDTLVMDAPAELIWELNTDVERWPAGTPTVQSVERLDDGPFRR